MSLWKILLLITFCVSALFGETVKHPWKVSFEGNDLYSNSQLEQELDLPEEFGLVDTSRQDFLMKLAQANIELLYYSNGYFSFKSTLKINKNATDDNSTKYTLYSFDISEGQVYTFNELSIIRDGGEDSVKISGLRFSRGNKYDPLVVSDDVQRLQTLYRNNGYLHVRADYIESLDTLHHVVNVEIYIEKGTQVLMGNFSSAVQKPSNFNNGDSTKSEGLSDTAWLSGLWRVPKGEIINGRTYTSFRTKLLSTQMFSSAKMEDSLRTDGLSDIHFNAVERIPGESRYSIFYEEEYGFGASATAKHKNFFGHFHEGSASILVAQNKQELTLGYANPLLFGTRFTFIPTAIRFDDHISLNHEKISPPAYPDSLEERYEVINRGDLTFGLSKNIHFRGTIDTRFVQKNEDRLVKLKLESAITFDFTDDYFNPEKGVRFAPTVGTGANFSGNIKDPELTGNPYTYGEITTSGYLPIYGPFLGAASASYGRFFAETIEDDARMFYQGGSRSVRGYRFRSIYPSYTTKEDGEEVIHTGLTPRYIRLNGELRTNMPFNAIKNWQLVQFYDWTKVSDKDSKTYASKTEASLGAGIRYKWQFLTLRLDYTLKKDFDNWGPEAYKFARVNFDLSQAF